MFARCYLYNSNTQQTTYLFLIIAGAYLFIMYSKYCNVCYISTHDITVLYNILLYVYHSMRSMCAYWAYIDDIVKMVYSCAWTTSARIVRMLPLCALYAG